MTYHRLKWLKIAFFGVIGLCGFSTLSSATLYSVGLDKNQFTSDYMIGSVVVSIIFTESDGTFDPNSETWSEDRKTQVLSEIMGGVNWWAQQNPRSPLRFTFVTETVTTRYEPITRPYYDEALWVPEVMGKLGHTGTRFAATRAYVNRLRSDHEADWGYVIFMVDSQVDTNGKFADGLFAYAYLGGPFMVMTYDNNGYGIANMDVVVAHETGHIFHALDQYAGASSPQSFSMGYFPTINGNHAFATTANTPDSIMRGGLRWGLDDWARQMIGWKDSNGNGRDDILDMTPLVSVNPQAVTNSSGRSFHGKATVSVVPRQNHPQGYGFNNDSISKVEYKIGENNWVQATAIDGAFDNPEENFMLNLTQASGLALAQSVNAQDINVRVVTASSLFVTSESTNSVPGDTISSLAEAHPFPNPFKPNSGLNHNQITFAGLTLGAKIQIFSPAGDPVFEKINDTSTDQVQWNAVGDDNKALASGVYLYLITDDRGNKKKGKLAIIR